MILLQLYYYRSVMYYYLSTSLFTSYSSGNNMYSTAAQRILMWEESLHKFSTHTSCYSKTKGWITQLSYLFQSWNQMTLQDCCCFQHMTNWLTGAVVKYYFTLVFLHLSKNVKMFVKFWESFNKNSFWSDFFFLYFLNSVPLAFCEYH